MAIPSRDAQRLRFGRSSNIFRLGPLTYSIDEGYVGAFKFCFRQISLTFPLLHFR
jgi:hypothetical protein